MEFTSFKFKNPDESDIVVKQVNAYYRKLNVSISVFDSLIADGASISSDFIKECIDNGMDQFTVAASMRYKVPYRSVTKDQRDDARKALFGYCYGRRGL